MKVLCVVTKETMQDKERHVTSVIHFDLKYENEKNTHSCYESFVPSCQGSHAAHSVSRYVGHPSRPWATLEYEYVRTAHTCHENFAPSDQRSHAAHSVQRHVGH